MKKLVCIVLTLSLLMTMGTSALALNYQQRLSNDATFETLEEAHANGAVYLSEATGRMYVPDPALDSYPAGTTYVYRSPGYLSCMTAGVRMNTNILVYASQSFESADAAKAYLADMGLIDIIDEAIGSIVLVTPINAEAGFGLADQMAFYQLQQAMCNIGYRVRGEVTSYYADSSYFGGLTYRYLIGIDGGATFVNEYIAGTTDYITRIAGLLLVGGTMSRVSEVASFVPTYLVNPTDEMVNKYKTANDVNAWGFSGDVTYYYNQAQPLQKVCVEYADSVDLKATVADAYYGMLVKGMRNSVLKANLNSASTEYVGYNFNNAPYSLAARNAVFNGKTADGLYVTEHLEDRFADIKVADSDEYLDYWVEVLPEEVLNGTAADGTIPLILCTHGSGDDPQQYLDEVGLLALAGNERVALVAPYHQRLSTDVDSTVMPMLVKYMLETYPALDASRVYATGYSMGGGVCILSVLGDLSLFAAAVPEGAVARWATDEQKEQWAKYDLPLELITCTYDFYIINDNHISDGVSNPLADHQGMINQFLTINEMENIVYDFETYPYIGTQVDSYEKTLLNNEFANHKYTLNNDEGVPMISYCITDFLVHALYQEYTTLAWDFMKHYSRDQVTGEIVYNPSAQ